MKAENIVTLPPVTGLDSLVSRYPFIMCDLWGVLHDGSFAFPKAVEALAAARKAGAHVILVSNSPQRVSVVEDRLRSLTVDSNAYDALVTSGELAREYLVRHFEKRIFFHLGPSSDRQTIESVSLTETRQIEKADVIVATGLAFQSVQDHGPLLESAAKREIPLLCANPDRIVRHAGQLAVCAGAVADLYESLGGQVIWLGKPAPPPFETCFRLFETLSGKLVEPAQVLMIGDGLVTDIPGAENMGTGSLLIESGVHHHEINSEGLIQVMERYNVRPDYRADHLCWHAEQ